MQEVRGKISIPMKRKRRFLLPDAGAAIYRKKIFDELGYFDEEHFAYLEDMDVGIPGHGSTDMKTGMHLMPWYTMWEAVPADPDIISSRSGILPEIIFI